VDAGVYAIAFHLMRREQLQVGRLGSFVFEPGLYVYVGSAQRNLTARLRRHARRRKRRHWHIDYLAAKARALSAWTFNGPKSQECRIARVLASRLSAPVRGFGCSDCRCHTHLFYLPLRAATQRPDAALARLPRLLPLAANAKLPPWRRF
jgi:sugar fermentation stimulation protein A